jgi:hypothetical protein
MGFGSPSGLISPDSRKRSSQLQVQAHLADFVEESVVVRGANDAEDRDRRW